MTFASASSQYLEAASAPTGGPATLACWFKCASDPSATVYLCGVGHPSAVTHLALGIAGATANNPIISQTTSAGVAATATSTGVTAVGTGTWYHACAVISSATSRDAYLNGGEKGSNTTSKTVSGIAQTRVASIPSNTAGSYFDGTIAEVGIWSVALGADEIAALAKGASPRLVRPASLVGYWPLIDAASPAVDWRGATPLTLNNTPTKADHPRIFQAF